MKHLHKGSLFIISLVFFAAGIATYFFIQPNHSIQLKQKNSKPNLSPWEFTSIDTMKYSRDNAKNSHVLPRVPLFVKTVADLGATHIAIGTPYDEEFYPVLKIWVKESRKNGLRIWFRGNFSGWQGWFDYPKLTDINKHHELTMKFIEKHPDLFEDGDIFTPVPEAENGGLGDPRGSAEKSAEFNQFLVDSYNNCNNAFAKIHKKVSCGYFSVNGGIAENVLTEETVKATGNIIVIDHYVDTPEKMSDMIYTLNRKFNGAKIVIGEFGAPIQDINGSMTEKQQADFVGKLLDVFYAHKAEILGINYWVVAGGPTALLREDDTPRLVSKTIKKYYSTKNQ